MTVSRHGETYIVRGIGQTNFAVVLLQPLGGKSVWCSRRVTAIGPQVFDQFASLCQGGRFRTFDLGDSSYRSIEASKQQPI